LTIRRQLYYEVGGENKGMLIFMKKILNFVIIICLIMFCSCGSNEDYDAWHLNSMKIDKLWAFSKGESQTIAFIDTGLTVKLQEAYKERIVAPYNFLDENDNIDDEQGHGTQMVSIACGDGSYGVYGIAPASKIMPIKSVNERGQIDYVLLAKSINYAVDNNATVICISLGGYKVDSDVLEAINRAIGENITVVAAAGDYAQKDLLFPANQNGVISVEAEDENNITWKESNISDLSTISFPGVKIKAIQIRGNDTIRSGYNDGTSQACVIASGYIALLRDKELNKNELNNERLITLLESLKTKEINKKTNYIKPFKSK